MQLHVARLCLDCQEVHAETRCPVCASESFAALSRWIPAPERRARVGLVVVWPEQPGDGIAGVRPSRDRQIDEESKRLAGIYRGRLFIDLDAWRPKHIQGDL